MNGDSISRRLLLAQLAAAVVSAQVTGSDDDPLRGLRVSHPRLIVNDAALERLRTLIRETPAARKIYGDLERECERLLTTPVIDYRLSGPRQVMQAGQILDRVSTLSLVFRVSGREPFLRRAVAELKSSAGFRDWNPQ